MTCEAASLLIANMDDLEETIKSDVLQHIENCPCCGNYHDQIIFINKNCKELNKLDIKSIDPNSLDSAKRDIIDKFCKKNQTNK